MSLRRLLTVSASLCVAGASAAIGLAGVSGAASTTAATAKSWVASHVTQPVNIPKLPALPRAPKKGVKVVFLSCSAPACGTLNPGFTAAADALGWKPTVITYNSATPGAAVQQAINEGFKYIATTSITLNTIEPEVAEAKAKGIALFGAYVTTTPGFASNDLYGVANTGTGDRFEGGFAAKYVVANSKGHAHVGNVLITLFPSLLDVAQGEKSEFAKLCPSTCSVVTIPVTLTELEKGQTGSAIASFLQAHSTINYLVLSFQTLDTGLVSALKAAGLTGKVKIVGGEGELDQMKEVASGAETAWTIVPEPYVMWTVVDWMARLSEGVLTKKVLAMDDTPQGVAWYVTNPSQAVAAEKIDNANSGVWPGPVKYQSEFKKLWHV